MTTAQAKLHFHNSLERLEAALAPLSEGSSYPFLKPAFLKALETSGSIGNDSGWKAHHATLQLESSESAAKVLAFAPIYRKTHSYGEYVFDHSWAQAFYQHGLDYYPKLINAIPFTPVSGPRALGEVEHQRALYQALDEHIRANQEGLSGIHVLFPSAEQAEALGDSWARRSATHFQWFNRGYQSFDDYLASFSSRKRKNLRKERQKIAEQGVMLERLVGDDITEAAWQAFLTFYQMTYLKRSGHTGYLKPAFFTELFEGPIKDQLLLVTAKNDEKLLGGALCFFDHDTLYGRYWGCIEEARFLHFEACYYQGIEFCIDRGLSRFDPGVQGEHKLQRGFEPVLTASCHRLQHPQFHEAIEVFCKEEKKQVLAYKDAAKDYLPFRREA